MRYRKLGSSNLEVSEISLGSWGTYAGGVAFEQPRACTDAASEAGINFFDTANAYGRGAAESVWGEILAGRPRDSYVLATKVWGQMSDDPGDQGLSAAQIAKQIDASLQRLRTDHVDLYQAHPLRSRRPDRGDHRGLPAGRHLRQGALPGLRRTLDLLGSWSATPNEAGAPTESDPRLR